MGRFVNPGNEAFRVAINSEIYIDKTGLIEYTNKVMNTTQAFICNSRPRRFGKSITADMLTAYYSRGCDSREIFSKFEISESPDFEKYRNKYNTIFLNMQEFLSRSDSVEALVDRVKKLVLRDLKREYPDVDYFDAGGRSWARLSCTYTIRSGKEAGLARDIFLLRKDDKGHWKIFGWEAAKER